ncbi:MAG: PQQ-binding-like beta-propeller repeat protein [Caldisericia bacterium]
MASVPAIKDSRVFVANRTFTEPYKQKFDCMDLETGEIVWSRGCPNSLTTSSIPLLIENDRIYIGYEGDAIFLECLSISDGNLFWENEWSFEGSLKSIICDKNNIFVAYNSKKSDRDVLECLDTETGKKVWQIDSNERNQSINRPFINDNMLLYSSDEKIVSHKKSNRKKLWELEGYDYSSYPLINNNILYFLSMDSIDFVANSISFVCFDTNSGKIIFRKDYPCYTDHGYRYFNSAISRGGKYLFFGAPNSHFACFDTEKRSLIWSFPGIENMEKSTATITFNSPVILESKVIATGFDGILYCFEIIDESQITDIGLNTEHVYLYPNNTFDFDLFMLNGHEEINVLPYVNPIWSVEPESLGIIDDNGLFTAGEEPGEGVIRVKFKDFEATAKITIDKEPEKRNVLKFVLGEKDYFYKSAKKEMDCPLTIKDERAFIDTSIIPNSFFGDSIYIETEDRAMCRLEANNIWFEKDNPIAIFNGKPIQIDPHNKNITPFEINEKLLVPLRFQAESLGCKTKWIADTKEVEVEFED